MIQECIDEQQPFGVVLIQEGQQEMGPATPFSVGCTAEIAHVEKLPGGRMNILALGRERFRIHSLSRHRPFLTGTVERFPLAVNNKLDSTTAGRRLKPWVARYLDLLSEIGDVEFDAGQLPSDPLTLAYLAATVLQVEAAHKQALLASENVESMLSSMTGLYRQELPVLRIMLEEGDQQREGPGEFSLN
jgi:Lon protease-like protein